MEHGRAGRYREQYSCSTRADGLFPVRLAFTDPFSYARRLAIGLDALTWPPAEHDAALSRGRFKPPSFIAWLNYPVELVCGLPELSVPHFEQRMSHPIAG